MQAEYCDILHNHEVSRDTQARDFYKTCPACKAIMEDWTAKIQQLQSDGV